MKVARHISSYGLGLLVALVAAVVLVLSTGLNATTHNTTPPAVSCTPAPVGSSNNAMSNVIALDGQQGGSSAAKRTAASYPTPVPSQPVSQTVDGYTVTLYPMYANANLIVLTYTVQSSYEDLSKVSRFGSLHGEKQPYATLGVTVPVGSTPPAAATSDPRAESYEPRLTDASNHAFPWLRDAGWQLYRDPATSVLVYDVGQLTMTLSARLQMHLLLNKAEVPIADEQGGATLHEVNGPYRFDFSLPLDPLRRIAEVNQTATTLQGDSITLVSAIVTRDSMRTTWRLNKSTQPAGNPSSIRGLYAYDLYACCTLKLDVGGHATDFLTTGYLGPQSGESGDKADVLIGSLLDEQGQWKISTWYYSTFTGDAYYPPEPGPVFRFSVPPAANSLQP